MILGTIQYTAVVCVVFVVVAGPAPPGALYSSMYTVRVQGVRVLFRTAVKLYHPGYNGNAARTQKRVPGIRLQCLFDVHTINTAVVVSHMNRLSCLWGGMWLYSNNAISKIFHIYLSILIYVCVVCTRYVYNRYLLSMTT